ncbi:WhiB family transcriptional regulator [Kitasatospora purpeofusca]|uniref:WhiB family transcriptional regulator n=1 Tax=Kitasatospora purpeofusca TaxID=67352 RepID=UPI0035DF4FD9
MIPAIEQRLPCTNKPTLFHAPDGRDYNDRAKQSRITYAKALCLSCPIVRECRQHARATREPHGIWGGETADERRDALAQAA